MAETLEKFIKSIAAYEAAPEIGAKYWETRKLDIAEVAKLIRKDIKASVKNGSIPSLKYSVRIGRGGRGYRAIDISTPEPPKTVKRDPVSIGLHLQYILRQYNYNASHGMYDYSCKRFFGKVTVGRRNWRG